MKERTSERASERTFIYTRWSHQLKAAFQEGRAKKLNKKTSDNFCGLNEATKHNKMR